MNVKEVFSIAIESLSNGKDLFMCCALEKGLDFDDCVFDIQGMFSKYGFTRGNFEQFVKRNYPEATKHIISSTGDYGAWMAIGSPLCKQCRVEFLKHLLNECKGDNPQSY